MSSELQREYFSPAEVGAVLGRREETIIRLIASGELAATKLGGRWLIHASELDRLRSAATAGPPANMGAPPALMNMSMGAAPQRAGRRR